MLNNKEFDDFKLQIKGKDLTTKQLLNLLKKNFVQELEATIPVVEKASDLIYAKGRNLKDCITRPKTDRTPIGSEFEQKKMVKVRTQAESEMGDAARQNKAV